MTFRVTLCMVFEFVEVEVGPVVADLSVAGASLIPSSLVSTSHSLNRIG